MKRTAFILSFAAALIFGACNNRECQKCDLLKADGSLIEEGDDVCQESLYPQGETDCEEKANLYNYNAQQNGSSDLAHCECDVEKSK